MIMYPLVLLNSFLVVNGLQLPALTMPFCITTWMMMFLRSHHLQPLHPDEVPAGHSTRALTQSDFLDSSIHSVQSVVPNDSHAKISLSIAA